MGVVAMDVDMWVELHTAACMVVKDIHVWLKGHMT